MCYPAAVDFARPTAGLMNQLRVLDGVMAKRLPVYPLFTVSANPNVPIKLNTNNAGFRCVFILLFGTTTSLLQASYGRGRGVGLALGVGVARGVGLTVGVGVELGVAVLSV